MISLSRLGLGCMGMSSRRNPENSVKTIHKALDSGITLFNTGEFYNAGESEMVVGRAMQGVPRDSYFLSVKFGVLPQPGGGIYGLDNKPFNVKGHLAYSLARLGMDYVDLYQPARQDTEIPVEEVVGEISQLVEAGYVRHIGLSMVDAETLRRACKVHPIHTVEMSYSLIDRSIENELIDAAKELGVKVLAFGTVGHGLFADNVLESLNVDPRFARGMLSGEHTIQHERDAIVKVTLASICSSDLHIKHGSVPRALEGITVGHKMVGIVEEVGPAVTHVKPGDRVTVNVETFCGECFFCKKGFVNNCTEKNGGWALGCRIDGGQAECVRVPFAD